MGTFPVEVCEGTNNPEEDQSMHAGSTYLLKEIFSVG